jgi:Heparinase II/III-like protein
MTLFLTPAALAERKQLLRDPAALGGLAGSLQRELHAALDVPVPTGKSRLTRFGGRCARCTVLLTFDPRQPFAHTCPTCGIVYSDAIHHEWWLMNAHLWTAEQCTRAAALAYLLDDATAATRADDILAAYTDRYLTWPNRDNALGPTRPFFSTYLESIWLLHLATALDLRIAATGGVSARYGAALERVVAPSAALIAGFDEGRSNRQVWHGAALFAAGAVLDDDQLRTTAHRSLEHLLRTGVHTDGSWYEGENYHLFAHRGLLSSVTLAERAGSVLPAALLSRFELGFAAPFRTMLPDGTFPARRDSQYGVTLRQYRTADWVECGLARHDTPELRAALAMLYADWPDAGDTGRWASTADAERNVSSVRLTRADCGWRALLLARPELPPLADAEPRSALLEGQGLAVFRRNGGKFWVGLDYGDPGDGHGHPDRLNLVIATTESRWLDDVGTGSYTSPTLSWYRSSMAHNAPMVNGQDQGAARGTLLAYDERDDLGWVSAQFSDPTSGVRFERSVLALPGIVVDEVRWTSDHRVTVDIPMQARLDVAVFAEWAPFVPGTAQDRTLTHCEMVTVDGDALRDVLLDAMPSPTRPRAAGAAPQFTCLLWSDVDAVLWRAHTIGAPAGAPHGLTSLRQQGRSGVSRRILMEPDVLAGAGSESAGAQLTLVTVSGETYELDRDERGWNVARTRHGTTERVELRGDRLRRAGANAPGPAPQASRKADDVFRYSIDTANPSAAIFAVITLGESNYRPTEDSWTDAGSPTAQFGIQVGAASTALSVSAIVFLGRPPVFAPSCAENPLDNEPPDTNSDGVQFHWRSFVTGEWNSVLAVPDGVAMRLTVTGGTGDGISATWSSDAQPLGYSVVFSIPWPGLGTLLECDCIINERPPGRERRRGQLVLSGAHGESAYLRGARQSPDRALRFLFSPAAP